jgi:hypothetical protein
VPPVADVQLVERGSGELTLRTALIVPEDARKVEYNVGLFAKDAQQPASAFMGEFKVRKAAR